MFDTVSLRHVLKTPLSDDEKSRASFRQKQAAYGKTFVCNLPEQPQLTYSEKFQNGHLVAALTAEESLPKSLYGNNAESITPDDLQTALDNISNYVTRQTGRDFDAHTAIVTRADACHNFQLENEQSVSSWLNALSTHSITRFRRIAYENSGVQFVPDNRTGKRPRCIVVYSKFRDVQKTGDDYLKQISTGLLRLEPRAMISEECKRIAKRFEVNQSAAEFLTPDVSKKMLSESIQKLAMQQTIDETALISLLVNRFGTKANNYVGFIQNWKNYGSNFWELGLISRSQFFTMKRELSKLGLLQTREGVEDLRLEDFQNPLPGLELTFAQK